ncbi:Oidioi.mRNA.OKI2018_I69.XSR.g15768.t2.cds [Oikopleura dioica]|uniref:Oidioi.mRNA.OKI2018_I69.XSR.g15768.t2.cds n=1 Tax=Oikopleura dioica TaxID=34765 RepID=A0ABN7SN60_OIKDI|nr:Oidioi.mRNA.OKI2018_I69.XSR.g15768.t2.cds [Oikopleura dioica]
MTSRVNDLRQLLNDAQRPDGQDPDYNRSESQNSTANPPPAFLTKLWQLVNEGDPDLVGWSESGKSFIVKDQNLFAKRVLPNYFKHQKMNSFVRQLNMYGFKKVPKMTEGTLHTVDYEMIEFQNELFVRGKPDLIAKIRRKDAKPRPMVTQNKHVTDLLEDLQDQQRQTHRDFERLKEKNSDLWRQVSTLRKKHDKQQDTVNRLISFMIHYIQQSPSNQLQLGQKRSALALTNGASDGNEGPYKMVRSNDYVTESIPKIAPESPLTSALRSTRGPVSLEDDDYGNSNTYFLKASSENAIMSSDPNAPEIQEIISDKPTHYNLELVDSPSTSGNFDQNGDPIKDIEGSIQRQETTLSNIITNIMSEGQQGDSFSFDASEMNFDDFAAG